MVGSRGGVEGNFETRTHHAVREEVLLWEGQGVGGGSPPSLARLKPGLSVEGQDLAEPGGRNNVRQVPAKLRERPSPVSLSALSQVQKSNLPVTPPAPLGNF